jgi:hypothetical protein
MLRAVAMVWLLTLGTSCALTADRTPSTPLSPPNASPADTPGPGGAPNGHTPQPDEHDRHPDAGTSEPGGDSAGRQNTGVERRYPGLRDGR